ncbi:MAG: EAL domain-containing protein [Rhodospirillales bacterium]|nr:EAL domain-containing protein [Rhodospirillales bacterium]
MNIKTKSVLSHLTAALAAIVLVLLLSFQLIKQTLQTVVSDQLEAHSAEAMNHLMTRLGEAALDFTSWATLFSMQDVLIDDHDRAIQAEIQKLITHFTHFSDLYVLNEKGEVVATTTAKIARGTAFADQPIFADPMAGRPYQGRVEDHPQIGRRGITLAQPIRAAYDPDVIIGVLVGLIEWQNFRDQLSQATILGELQSEKMGLVLVDAATQTPLYGEAFFEPRHPNHDFVEAHARGTPHPFELGGRPFLHGTTASWEQGRLADPRWQLHAVAEADVAYRPITLLRNKIALFGLGITLLVSLAGFWAASHLIRPIAAITEALRHVAQGDIGFRLALKQRNDEIGEMADMLQVFKDHVVAMERLAVEKAEAEAKSRELLTDAIEALVQPVAVWDGADRYVYGNSKYATLIGTTANTLAFLKPGTDFELFLRGIAQNGHYPGSAAEIDAFLVRRLTYHRRAEGTMDIEMASGPVLRVAERRTQAGGTVSTYFDITEFKRRAEAMDVLISPETRGLSFAEKAAQAIAVGLDFRMAGIGLLAEDGITVRVLAVWHDGGFRVPFGYRLPGTPCEAVFQDRSFCFHDRGVARQFPEDKALVDMGAEAYVGVPFFDHDGRLVGHMFAVHDRPVDLSEEWRQLLFMIGRWVEAEYERERVEDSRRKLFRAVEQSPVSVMITDPQGRIEYVNPKFLTLSGYAESEVLGQSPRILKSGKMPIEIYQDLWETIRQGQEWQGELLNRKKDGTLFWESVVVSPVRGPDGRVTNYVAVKEDITLFKKYQERLVYQAQYDHLTDLPNRRLALDRLDKALKEVTQKGGRVAVLFIDLDRFKNVNDTLGHAVGDMVLRQAASRLSMSISTAETLARLGGDEFLLILPGVREMDEVERIATRIVNSFTEPFFHANREIYLTASVGITLAPEHGTDPHLLLQNADAAMYFAKEGGRSKWHLFTPDLLQSTIRRVEVENALRHALERNEFTLHYQPLIEARTGELIGAEALIRWSSSDLGAVPPDHFIAIAEETNLILSIGAWVLDTAAKTIGGWSKIVGRPLVIAINVAANQFRSLGLVDEVQAILDRYALAPEQLELEITERLIMDDSQDSRRTLDALRALGVRLSIDDFGTGYSSFSYLSRFPLDTLKIDRSFVAGVEDDASAATLTRAIIAMAHGLGLEVVAEGIEAEGQRRFLVAEGCDFLQGYFFSRPLPADVFHDTFIRPRVRV